MTFFYVIQFCSALGLVLTILLHSPKGEGFGAIGGQGHMFSQVKGLEAGLDRLTKIFAFAFILISIIITIKSA